MVWGLIQPGSFGDYFPDGEYVGDIERLTKYFNEEMPAEFRAQFKSESGSEYVNSYIHWASKKFIYEPGRKFSGKPALLPIEPHERPTEFKAFKLPSTLASLIILNDRLLAVDEALKNIIERLEPGIHSFQPIQIGTYSGKQSPRPYFVMVIGSFLESFSPEMSEPGSWERRQSGMYQAAKENKQVMSGLAFSSSVIGTAHLWRERKIDTSDFFMSDELQREITKAGLRVWKHFKLKGV